MELKLINDMRVLSKMISYFQIILSIVLIANLMTIRNEIVTLCVASSALTLCLIDMIMFVINCININRIKSALGEIDIESLKKMISENDNDSNVDKE